MLVGTIVEQLELDTTPYDKGMAAATQTAAATGRKMEKAIAQSAQDAGRSLSASLIGGLEKVQGKLQGLSGSLLTVGGALLGAGGGIKAGLMYVTNTFSQMGDGMAKAAKRSMMTTEEFSRLSHVADQSGVSVGALDISLRYLNRNAAEAARGSKVAQRAFEQLGISASDLEGLSGTERLGLVADKLKAIEDPAAKTNAAMTLLGRAGTMLFPMFEEGSEGIRKLTEEADRLGFVISNEDGVAAEELNDAIANLWKSLKFMAFNIGAAVAPMMKDFALRAVQVTAGISAWIRKNPDLIIGLAKTATKIAAVGAVLVGLGTAAKIAAVGIGVLTTAFKLLLSPILAIPLAIAGAIAAGLAIAGAIQELLGMRSVFDMAIDGFNGVKETATKSFNAIAEALKRGDIEAAWQVVCKTMKLYWTQMITAIKETYYGMLSGLFDVAESSPLASVMRGLMRVAGGASGAPTSIERVQGYLENRLAAVQEEMRKAQEEYDAAIARAITPQPAEVKKAAPGFKGEKPPPEETKPQMEVVARRYAGAAVRGSLEAYQTDTRRFDAAEKINRQILEASRRTAANTGEMADTLDAGFAGMGVAEDLA